LPTTTTSGAMAPDSQHLFILLTWALILTLPGPGWKGEAMEITRSGSQPSSKGPAEWFSGDVIIHPLFETPDPARVRGASVTFQPGARTAWHTYPLGQTLIVTAGLGRTQRWGRPIEEIRPGDVVTANSHLATLNKNLARSAIAYHRPIPIRFRPPTLPLVPEWKLARLGWRWVG
jgi:quercetin dioxygenase-like cupin family protein